MHHKIIAAVAAVSAALVFLGSGSAWAQGTSPTLSRIAESGEFRIGFVPDAPPMSFLDDQGNAVGYSIELCRAIAAAIRTELGLESLDLSF